MDAKELLALTADALEAEPDVWARGWSFRDENGEGFNTYREAGIKQCCALGAMRLFGAAQVCAADDWLKADQVHGESIEGANDDAKCVGEIVDALREAAYA